MLIEKYKIYDVLDDREKAFLDLIREEGYSFLRVRTMDRALNKREKIELILDEAEIEYYNVKHYYGFLVVLTCLGAYLSTLPEISA